MFNVMTHSCDGNVFFNLHTNGGSFVAKMSGTNKYGTRDPWVLWDCVENTPTLPETNIAPKNGWFQYYFPIGTMLVSGRVLQIDMFWCQQFSCKHRHGQLVPACSCKN